MSEEISTDDRLSRVVCTQNRNNYFRVSTNEVKPKAFKPNRDGDTSLFVTTSLSEVNIWSLGEDHVCGVDKVCGRADILAEVILGFERLVLDYNNDPEYHVNLKWPEEMEDIQEMAQVLAAEANCVFR